MIHVNHFIESLRAAQARGLKDMTIKTSDAIGLHADITRLLMEIRQLKAADVAAKNTNATLAGGEF